MAAATVQYEILSRDTDNDVESMVEDDLPTSYSLHDSPPTRSLLHIIALNAFGFAYGVLIATYGLITLPSESEHMYPTNKAVMLAVFLAVAGISQLSGPVAGFFSDRCTHILGRRRPFLLVGGMIGFVGLLVQYHAHKIVSLPLYLTAYFISMLALNVMYTSYSGALTDLVPENQRGQANGIMGVMAVLGASFGFGMFSQYLTIQSGYLFYCGILAATTTISLLAMRERPLTVHQPWTWSDLWLCYYISPTHHRDFFLVFLSRTMYYMCVSVQTFMLFYFRDLVHSKDPKDSTAWLALCGQLAGAIVCYPIGLLSDRIGRKPVLYIASVIIIAVYIGFIFTRSVQSVLICGVVYGVGNGAYLAVDYALACDTLPNKKDAARYLGVWGVAAFVGTMMGPLIHGPLLVFFGDKGEKDAEGATMYASIGYTVVLLVGCLCMIGNAIAIVPVRAK